MTLGELFGASAARGLARTLPADVPVHFRLRIPATGCPCGALVFVKPEASGAFVDAWAPVFEAHRLVWVSADRFGNDKPTAQRVLVALMARELARRITTIEDSRIYLAGMSGGGRVASQIMMRFPQEFAGALYVVGADFHAPAPAVRAAAFERRYVFLTGARDFNRREMRRVSRRYQKEGAARVLLIDEPDFGHGHATAPLMARAMEFLEAR